MVFQYSYTYRTALTDANGNIEEEYNYDAWGRRRNVTDWTDYSVTNPELLTRGFTGHSLSREERNGKHLDDFGIINMNGRLYDPILGRMLSPDNYVQMPDYSQNLNRYTYALNNPLVYTDPDGESVSAALIIGGAIVGAYIGGALYEDEAWIGNWQFRNNNELYSAMGIGAMAGAGAGALLAAGIGAAGTGFDPGFGADGGVASVGWNMASEALLTSNINMASTFVQGGDLNEIAAHGTVGLFAGAVGGYVGNTVNTSIKTGNWSQNDILAQNLTTSTINGGGTRLVSSYMRGQKGIDPWVNSFKGSVEGFYLGYLGSNSSIANIGRYNKAGRYLSSFVSQTATSIPGLGFTIGYYHSHAAAYSFFNATAGSINPFITTAFAFSEFINVGAGIFSLDKDMRDRARKLQIHTYYNEYIIGSNYPTVIRPFAF